MTFSTVRRSLSRSRSGLRASSGLRAPSDLRAFLALCLAAGLVACGTDDLAQGAGEAGADGPDGPDGPASGAAEEAAADLQGGTAVAGGLEIGDAVVTEPVTGERAALYLTVAAASGAGDVLLGVDAAGAGAASLHRTERAGDGSGGMTMLPVDSLVVEPGDRLLLRPGGIHGMLEELEGTWTAGDTVAVSLRFREAGSVELRAPVVGYGALDRLFPPASGGGG